MDYADVCVKDMSVDQFPESSDTEIHSGLGVMRIWSLNLYLQFNIFGSV